MLQYDIQPYNLYNMDEKGFMIGMLKKTKRVFDKEAFERGQIVGNTQDGNCEWITAVCCICADGTHIPPGLIYKAKTGDVQDSWVQDLNAKKDLAFFTSSSTGWTNDDLGFEWLTGIFDQFSKGKAWLGRDWRLLMLDGHGSHLNMRFLDWCLNHRIMVGVYPPHSTHRLQPLDVSVFAPLGIYYGQSLDHHIYTCQGITAITKRDFFRFFWEAYQRAFTSKNIASGWQKTGIWPLNPDLIIDQLRPPPQSEKHRPESNGSLSSVISSLDWKRITTMFKDLASDLQSRQERQYTKLLHSIEHITADAQLHKIENRGWRQAFMSEKKKGKKGRPLFEELQAQNENKALFFSPTKIEEAKQLLQDRDQQKVNDKAKRDAAAIERRFKAQMMEFEKERNKKEREEAKLVRKQEQAKKKAIFEDKKTDKAVQQQLEKEANIANKASDNMPAKLVENRSIVVCFGGVVLRKRKNQVVARRIPRREVTATVLGSKIS